MSKSDYISDFFSNILIYLVIFLHFFSKMKSKISRKIKLNPSKQFGMSSLLCTYFFHFLREFQFFLSLWKRKWSNSNSKTKRKSKKMKNCQFFFINEIWAKVKFLQNNEIRYLFHPTFELATTCSFSSSESKFFTPAKIIENIFWKERKFRFLHLWNIFRRIQY